MSKDNDCIIGSTCQDVYLQLKRRKTCPGTRLSLLALYICEVYHAANTEHEWMQFDTQRHLTLHLFDFREAIRANKRGKRLQSHHEADNYFCEPE
jgi:hypothetical protein